MYTNGLCLTISNNKAINQSISLTTPIWFVPYLLWTEYAYALLICFLYFTRTTYTSFGLHSLLFMLSTYTLERFSIVRAYITVSKVGIHSRVLGY